MLDYITTEEDLYQTLKQYKDIVSWYTRSEELNEQVVIDITGEGEGYVCEGGQRQIKDQNIQISHICRKNSLETRPEFAKFMKANFNYSFSTLYDDENEYYYSVYTINHILKEWC